MRTPLQTKNHAEVSSFFFFRIHIDNKAAVFFTTDRSVKTLPHRCQKSGDSTGGTPWSCFCHSSISSVDARRYFISGDATRERVGGGSRLFDVLSQAPQNCVFNGCFGCCMFFGGSSATFSVKPKFLVCGPVALRLTSAVPLARFLQIGARFYVKYFAVVSLPDGPRSDSPSSWSTPWRAANHTLTRGPPNRLADGPGASGPSRAPPWPHRQSRTACHLPQSRTSTFFMVSSKTSLFLPPRCPGLALCFWFRSIGLSYLLRWSWDSPPNVVINNERERKKRNLQKKQQ